MSNKLDMIAKVNIDISNPVQSEETYDCMLIVGPLPKVAPQNAPAKVGVYTNLGEVESAGWVATGKDADPIGIAARMAFTQKHKPSAIYIAPIQEEAEGKLESAKKTVERALETPGWYVVCTAGVSESEYEEIAEFVETVEKMFCYTEMNFLADEEYIPTVSGDFARTHFIYGRVYKEQPDEEIPEENKYLNVGFVAEVLSYASGSETYAFKKLNGFTPSDLSEKDMNAIAAVGSYFTTIANRTVTMGGKVLAGEWCDIIRFRDWLKNDMQTRVAVIFLDAPKVPYSDSGIGLVQNQMLASLKAGQDAGGIAEEEFDESGKSIPAYSTSVPRASSVSAANKAARKLTDCKFKARLSGAIHIANLEGSVAYEM